MVAEALSAPVSWGRMLDRVAYMAPELIDLPRGYVQERSRDAGPKHRAV
jgi:hypothetical protein